MPAHSGPFPTTLPTYTRQHMNHYTVTVALRSQASTGPFAECSRSLEGHTPTHQQAATSLVTSPQELLPCVGSRGP